MDMMQSIIKREFEAVAEVAVKKVEFTEDERIIVTTEQDVFVMQIASDDDELVFVSQNVGDEIRFPYPADWDAAIDENNFS